MEAVINYNIPVEVTVTTMQGNVIRSFCMMVRPETMYMVGAMATLSAFTYNNYAEYVFRYVAKDVNGAVVTDGVVDITADVQAEYEKDINNGGAEYE